MVARQRDMNPTTDVAQMQVADAMHRGVVTCSRETSLVTVAHLMGAQRIHCVVIVAAMPDNEVKLCGVVSDRDVLAAAVCGDIRDDTAEGCAATEVVTVEPSDSLLSAAELMHDHGVTHAVVVVPGTSVPVGILSALDVAAVLGRVWPEPKVASTA